MLDLIQGAALLEDLAQVARDEELRHRHQGVEERTHAQDDATLPAVPGSIPPSTSMVEAPTTLPSLPTLSGESAMNGWPPQPGLTVMQRKTSASFTDSLTAATGVPGLIARPARQPSSRIAFRVRLMCAVASAWKVIESAPALANSSM